MSHAWNVRASLIWMGWVALRAFFIHLLPWTKANTFRHFCLHLLKFFEGHKWFMVRMEAFIITKGMNKTSRAAVKSSCEVWLSELIDWSMLGYPSISEQLLLFLWSNATKRLLSQHQRYTCWCSPRDNSLTSVSTTLFSVGFFYHGGQSTAAPHESDDLKNPKTFIQMNGLV